MSCYSNYTTTSTASKSVTEWDAHYLNYISISTAFQSILSVLIPFLSQPWSHGDSFPTKRLSSPHKVRHTPPVGGSNGRQKSGVGPWRVLRLGKYKEMYKGDILQPKIVGNITLREMKWNAGVCDTYLYLTKSKRLGNPTPTPTPQSPKRPLQYSYTSMA